MVCTATLTLTLTYTFRPLRLRQHVGALFLDRMKTARNLVTCQHKNFKLRLDFKDSYEEQ
jgi:hypothetical protein